MADLRFYFDPTCPFAWMTSKWAREVAEQRSYAVDWRFISLRLVNADVDYAEHFPPGYEAGHSAGLALLRVAAEARRRSGPEVVGPLYQAMGSGLFEEGPAQQRSAIADPQGFAAAALAAAGLEPGLAEAVTAAEHDRVIQDETDEALDLTGRDVGTPILHFDPPGGTALFGPVISRLPDPADAVALWDHVLALSRFPGFAEIKRSLREVPQLPALGVGPEQVGTEEDWQKGRRRSAIE